MAHKNASEKVINVLTLDNFSFAAGEGRYSLPTPTGEVIIDMVKKTSHIMPGDYTGYDCTIDGKTYEKKNIGFYKKMFGAVVNHREGTTAATAKVLTEDEITAATVKMTGTLNALQERAAKVLAVCGVSYEPSFNIPAAVAAYRVRLEENNAKARAEKAAAEKAAAERAEKAEKKDLAKKVLTADDYTRAITAAALAGDYATVAALTAEKIAATA